MPANSRLDLIQGLKG